MCRFCFLNICCIFLGKNPGPNLVKCNFWQIYIFFTEKWDLAFELFKSLKKTLMTPLTCSAFYSEIMNAVLYRPLWKLSITAKKLQMPKHLKKKLRKDFSAKAFRIALSSAGESLILSKSVFAKSGEEVNGKSWNNLISDTIAKKGMLSPSVLRS